MIGNPLGFVRCGVLTVEIEHVDAATLEKLEKQGVDCEPKASTIMTIQALIFSFFPANHVFIFSLFCKCKPSQRGKFYLQLHILLSFFSATHIVITAFKHFIILALALSPGTAAYQKMKRSIGPAEPIVFRHLIKFDSNFIDSAFLA
jgi:hypothetical protein